MVREVMYPEMQRGLIEPLSSGVDPIQEIYEMMKALHSLVDNWHEAMQATIENGKSSGSVNRKVNPRQVAAFIFVGYSGVRNMGKLYGASSCTTYLSELKKHLETLR